MKTSGTPANMADIVCAPQMVLTMSTALIESDGNSSACPAADADVMCALSEVVSGCTSRLKNTWD